MLLLSSLNDAHIRSRSHLETASGVAPGRRVPCTFCHKTGRRLGRPCPACDGRKWRQRRRGEPAWDEYTGERVGTKETRPRDLPVMSPQQIDSELRTLRSNAAERAGRLEGLEEYGWERALRLRNAKGSYRELERALDELRSEWPGHRHLIALHFESGLDVPNSYASRVQLVEALKWLSLRMGRARLPSALYEQLKTQRRARTLALKRANPSWGAKELAEGACVSMRLAKTVIGMPVLPGGVIRSLS